jgi:hypothetical protein
MENKADISNNSSPSCTRSSIFFFLGLACYCLFFYRDILFQGLVYVFRDTHTILLPMEHIARILSGEKWPALWNPFMVLGKPFAAEPLSGVFYPPNWILRILKEPIGWNTSIAVHHLLAAWGGYALLKNRGFSKESSFLASIVFSFGGALVSCDNMINALQSAVWLPWTLWAFDCWYAKRNFKSLALVSTFMTLTLLGGMPEVLLFENILIVSILIEKHLAAKTHPILLDITAVFFINLIWIGLGAVFLFPFLEYLLNSSRASGLKTEAAVSYSFSILRFPAFFLPELLQGGLKGFFEPGPSSSNITYSLNWAVTLYIGPILALIIGIRLKTQKTSVIIWTLTTIFFLLLALGGNLPGYKWLLEILPFLRVARYPEKFLIVVSGLLALGIACGFEYCRQDRYTSFRTAGLAAVTALAGIIYYCHSFNFELIYLAVFAFITAAGCVTLARSQKAGFTLLLFTALFTLLRVNQSSVPTLSWTKLTARPEILKLLSPSDSPFRIYSNSNSIPSTGSFPEDELIQKRLLYRTMANFYGLANLNTPSSINLAVHDQLIPAVETAEPECAIALLRALNVSYITSYKDLTRYPDLEIQSGPPRPGSPILYKIKSTYPRVYVAETLILKDSIKETIAALCQYSNSSRTAVLSKSDFPGDIPLTNTGTAQIEYYGGDEIGIKASLKNTGILVISDTYYPGWKAQVNGQEKEIIPINHFVRGIQLEKGSHSITLFYRPLSYRIGVLVSICTLIILLSSLYILARHRRIR